MLHVALRSPDRVHEIKSVTSKRSRIVFNATHVVQSRTLRFLYITNSPRFFVPISRKVLNFQRTQYNRVSRRTEPPAIRLHLKRHLERGRAVSIGRNRATVNSDRLISHVVRRTDTDAHGLSHGIESTE